MTKPKIENAPGLTWRSRKRGWEARWHARHDLIHRGYGIKSYRIGVYDELSEIEIEHIQSMCLSLQNEMLIWANGGPPMIGEFDGTLRGLIVCYQTDPDSPYRKLRYNTRTNYDQVTRRIDHKHGHELVREIKARTLLRWHEIWSDGGKVAMGHSMIAMLRTLMTFGSTIIDSEECRAVKNLLRDMKFKNAAPSDVYLTAEHAVAIRTAAHAKGRKSIALAQAIQFECMLRQKDVIGEWVPISEPGFSILVDGNSKWMRGLDWNEIDQNLILRHLTSKRQKLIEIDLKNAPMVMAELQLWGDLPASGPVIVSERTGLPYGNIAFRRQWRELANAAGIPKAVKNMHSRPGGATEATDAGAQLEDLRHAMTHSDISMTARYSRGTTGKIVTVQNLRSEHRNKPKS